MTGRRGNRRGDTASFAGDDVVVVDAPSPAIDARVVTFGFTDEQLAYLDERIRLARQIRPMGRVGGSSLRRICSDSLLDS